MEPKGSDHRDEDQYWLERAREAEKSGFLGAEETMEAIEKRLAAIGVTKEQLLKTEGILKHLSPERNMTDELLADRWREAENE